MIGLSLGHFQQHVHSELVETLVVQSLPGHVNAIECLRQPRWIFRDSSFVSPLPTECPL